MVLKQNGGLEADLQFQRLDIEQEKTYLCVIRFSELHGTFFLKGGSAQESSCLCICHLAYTVYAGRSSFIQFWEGSLVCGVYHWQSVLRNIIFQADKVHRSDPNFIVPRGSDVHTWLGWLPIEAGL